MERVTNPFQIYGNPPLVPVGISGRIDGGLLSKPPYGLTNTPKLTTWQRFKMISQHNEYQFEWDARKAASNLRKHKNSFEQAATVFKDKLAMTVYDEAHSLIEERWFTLGINNLGNLLAISHTFQDITDTISRVRIISARLATRQEQDYYENS